MNIVNYKGTNLRVSDIALGGGVLGSRISDQASFDILDCFVGNGGTFIDTANVVPTMMQSLILPLFCQ